MQEYYNTYACKYITKWRSSNKQQHTVAICIVITVFLMHFKIKSTRPLASKAM